MTDSIPSTAVSRSSSRRLLSLVLGLSFVTFVTDTDAVAQRDKKPPKVVDAKWRDDPFTHQDAELLKAAGYVRIDRIGWSEGFDSSRIEQSLGRVKIRWIETAHFRIGCGLQTWTPVGHDKPAKKRLKNELKTLRAKLPKVPRRAKTVSPWLRAHLFAQRLEALYADLITLLDAKDGGANPPFLHCREKFRVVLFDEQAPCVRFTQTFRGPKGKSPMRWYDNVDDCYTFASAVEFAPESYGDDTKFFCHIAFHVTHNLIDAFHKTCGQYHTPIWWKEGLAHFVQRQIADNTNVFTDIKRRDEFTFATTDWERRVLGAMKHGITKPFASIGKKLDYQDLSLQDHMEMFSRVDFLRSLGDEKFGDLIVQIALPAIDPQRRIEYQHEALAELYGFQTAEAFDAAWIQWAKRAYRKKT